MANNLLKKLTARDFLPQAFLCILILLIPFIHTSSTLDPSLSLRHFALNVLIVISLIIYLRRYKNGPDLNQTLIIIYIVYLLISAFSIIYALNKAEAVFEWFKILTFFSLFLLVFINLSSTDSYRKILPKLIIIYILIVSIWGFYEFIKLSSFSTFDHQSTYFIRAFSSNRNLFSQILFLAFPFSLYGSIKLKSTWKILSVLSSAFIIILTTILLVRAVWIALFISFVTSTGVYLFFSKSTDITKTFILKITLTITITLILVASGIFIFSNVGNPEVFRKQVYWIENYKFGSSLERLDIWEKTLELSKDNLLTGVGPGNWRINFPAYGLENIRPESGEIFFQRPHNDFLWVLSEYGIFGFICYLLFYILAFYNLIKSFKNSEEPEQKYFSLAVIFGLTGYLVISMFSFPKERIEHQIYFHLFLAISMVGCQNPSKQKKVGKHDFGIFLLYILLFLVVIGSYLSYSRLISEKHIYKATNFRLRQDWNNEIKEFSTSASLITNLDAFSTPISWYIGEAYFKLIQIDSADLYFQRAYGHNPYHLHVLNNLGTTNELKGQHFEAEEFFLQAHQIAPKFEDPIFNLCALYYNQKNYDKAIVALRKIDPATKNPKYLKYLKIVLWNKINEMNHLVNDRLLYKSIERIRNSDEWMTKVFLASLENETSFEKQTLTEAIYLLESVDSTITSSHAKYYKTIYNLQ